MARVLISRGAYPAANYIMTELTQLERARAVVDAFVPQDKPGAHYIYAYLGKATYDATQYEIIDGLCLASKRIWHLDESQTDCVAYVGEGCNGRINETGLHPFIPNNRECRIKLYEGASKADAQEIECLLIAELGCILDDSRTDGCLANIRYFHNGPHCCSHLEAFTHKAKFNGGNAAAAAACSIKTYAMKADKCIIATGSMTELARQFDMATANISKCCLGKSSGIWSRKLDHAIYFCKVEDYETYQIKPMTKQELFRNRILIAAKLDGSDICCGTAAEIATYAPEIKHSRYLHRVARGNYAHAYGWTCKYADKLEAPIATCGPSLSAFF